jgi:type II restriction/modification system DNA methylase subunit YeeA
MTPDEFVARWAANTRNEAAASKPHFLDLCTLLDVPVPATDPTGATYAFEKGATKAAGGAGWADVWKRGCFAWEYKSRGGDLEKAHDQLLRYAGALGNPPLLITSDMDRIVVRTNWTNEVSARHEFALDDLRNPAVRARLRQCWTAPDAFKPGTTRQALTERAAASFAGLAGRLRDRGHPPPDVAHFVIRLVFCLFADDVGLLPSGLFERMLGAAHKAPARFADYASRLFRAMAERGGEVDFTPIAWFNGGLFDDDTALPLEAADIADLSAASALDWSEIDPSIMGTLFERGLNPDKRAQLGAHYTDREKIERLIDPVIRRPLLAEWEAAKARIAADMQRAEGKVSAAARRNAQRAAATTYRQFLDRLRAFRVLDPACGSGNFLYLSLLALKDLELQASVEAEALGLPPEFPQVGPEAVLGIELDPYAAELARVSVWIGHIQWARRHGMPTPENPVLRKLDTIECRDAVLALDGTRAAWPKVDAIVGNPPFLGAKEMIGRLGEDYTDRLRRAYRQRVAGRADFVAHWFDLAREAIRTERAKYAGLVATQAIRKGASQLVLAGILEEGKIFEAWSDEAWNVDGAAVRVSLVCFGRVAPQALMLNGQEVPEIFADLSAGRSNLLTAQKLKENRAKSFQGPVRVGPFDIPGDVARQMLTAPLNPNARPNADVVRPWANGKTITDRPADTWIIDFGERSEHEASFFAAPFAWVATHVKPFRDTVRRDRRRLRWWQHGETMPGLHRAIAGLDRFLVTPYVSKHRVFSWLDGTYVPDMRLAVIARDDDVSFGILQSRFHSAWALALGARHGVGNDPTYNNQSCFETFPFPDGLTPDRPATDYAADPHAQDIAAAAADLVAKRDAWLNPPDLVEVVPEVVPGFPDRILPKNAEAAAILKKRTLTALYNTRGTPEGAWLDGLHRRLDEAVAAAYGWPADIAEDDALARLLALNLARTSRTS